MAPLPKNLSLAPTAPTATEPSDREPSQPTEHLSRALENSPYFCLVSPGPDGRIRAKLERIGEQRIVHEYAYDQAGRLVQVKRNGQVTEHYAYDARGRRAYEQSAQRGHAGRLYVYSDNDQLLRAGDQHLEYDSMGRLLKRHQGDDFTYYLHQDPGFLGSVKLPGNRWVAYKLDAKGRPSERQEDLQRVQGYTYDRFQRLSVVHEPGQERNWYYSYANDKARLPQGMEDVEGNHYVFGFDHLGSLRAVVDGSGRVVKEIDYDSFGNILRETNPDMRIPFGFAGGMHDRVTGLVKFRFRDYMPDVGRFTAKDPIGYQGGDEDLYGYCLDDPINGIDPSGLLLVHSSGEETPISTKVLTDALSRQRGESGLYFDSVSEAVKHAIKDTLENKETAVEWGGLVYETDDGRFTYNINPGIPDSIEFEFDVPGTKAIWHTHNAQCDDGFSRAFDSRLSSVDRELSESRQLPIYLGSCDENMMSYTPDPQQENSGIVSIYNPEWGQFVPYPRMSSTSRPYTHIPGLGPMYWELEDYRRWRDQRMKDDDSS